MSVTVWVLSFSILGVDAKHGEYAKYATQDECNRARVALHIRYEQQHKSVSTACIRRLK